jgi:hypothetical protein
LREPVLPFRLPLRPTPDRPEGFSKPFGSFTDSFAFSATLREPVLCSYRPEGFSRPFGSIPVSLRSLRLCVSRSCLSARPSAPRPKDPKGFQGPSGLASLPTGTLQSEYIFLPMVNAGSAM